MKDFISGKEFIPKLSQDHRFIWVMHSMVSAMDGSI